MNSTSGACRIALRSAAPRLGILTFEDPIESVCNRSCQSARDGHDTESLEQGAAHAMRQAPDVLFSARSAIATR